MIEISQLTKTYGGKIAALRGLDLTIDGGMFGLIGPNGAGKTTLMRILAGLVRPTSGSVRVLGHDVNTATGKFAIKSVLGYLPQELGLYPNLTGREFVDYVAILKGVTDRATRRKQVDDVLAQVRLTDVADRQMKTYSGGMKRRVGIAQAMLGQPQLLIVDEPTAGLDPEERVRLRNLLAELAARCTVILSTHIVEDISQSCNQLAVICQGQVLFRGSPRELIAQARDHVWLIATAGERPNSGVTIVSTLQLQDAIQYRVLGSPGTSGAPTGYAAQPIEPSLEDGYMWLMRRTTDARTNG